MLTRGRHCTLEVERKFSGLAVQRLTRCAGRPAFLQLVDTGHQRFSDTYFDLDDKLSSRGIWLRKRQYQSGRPIWQAKCRRSGTYINSIFEEVTDVQEIARRVQDITGVREPHRNDYGLGIIASMSTSRESWLADEKFKIVLDKMDFGHTVSEVELEETFSLPNMSTIGELELWKTQKTNEMDRQVEAFMHQYSWTFQQDTPIGKLSAYFDRRPRSNVRT